MWLGDKRATPQHPTLSGDSGDTQPAESGRRNVGLLGTKVFRAVTQQPIDALQCPHGTILRDGICF